MAQLFFIQGRQELTQLHSTNTHTQAHKAQIWTQAPTTEMSHPQVALIDIPGVVSDGPASPDIVIKGVSGKVQNDENHDFLLDPLKQRGSFDVVHVFSMAASILDMYRHALKGLGYQGNLEWQWGNEPLKIFPFAGDGRQAIYDRQKQALSFYYYFDEKIQQAVYTCESLDTVARTMGQAIIDALQPGYVDSVSLQTKALSESFSDLTILFFLLNHMNFCHDIYIHSKGDLKNPLFFEQMGQPLGFSIGEQSCFKQVLHDLKLSDVLNEPKECSKVFTATIYEILSDLYESHKQPCLYHASESLYRVSNHLRSLLTLAIVQGPKQTATFEDIAHKMIALEPNPDWKEKIHHHFTERGILSPRLNSEKDMAHTSELFKKSEKFLEDDFSSTQMDYLIDLPKPKINKQSVT